MSGLVGLDWKTCLGASAGLFATAVASGSENKVRWWALFALGCAAAGMAGYQLAGDGPNDAAKGGRTSKPVPTRDGATGVKAKLMPQGRDSDDDGATDQSEADAEEQIDQVFDLAQKAASSLKKVDNDTKLELYSLFKQSTVGPCNTPKPSMLDFVASAKWKSWNKLGNMSSAQAKTSYIAKIDELLPGWNEMDKEQLEELKKKSGGAVGGGMGVSVSTFAVGEEKSHEQQTDHERLLSLAGEGESDKLLKALAEQKISDVNSVRGEDEETLLHMCCDRGNLELIGKLLQLGADIEARDIEGMTPLAYALINENEQVAVHLVEKFGADKSSTSSDGTPILSLCGATLKQKLLSL